MAIITAAQARVYIPGLTGTGEDSTLDTIITHVDAALAAFLGFPPYDSSPVPTLEDQTYTLYMDGPGGRVLRCPIRPVQSVTTLHDDPAWSYGTAELVAATDYDGVDRLADGLIILDEAATWGNFSDAPQAIKLVVVAGFTTIPLPLQRAAAMWTAAIYKHRGSVNEQSVNEVQLRPETMPDAVRELAAPYRCMTALLMGA